MGPISARLQFEPCVDPSNVKIMWVVCCDAPLDRVPTTDVAACARNRTLGVCQGPACTKDGSRQALLNLRALETALDAVTVQEIGCLGECGDGPNVYDGHRKRRGIRGIRDVLGLLSELGCDPVSMEQIELWGLVVDAILAKEDGDRAFVDGQLADAVAHYSRAMEALESRDGESVERLAAAVRLNRVRAVLDSGLIDGVADDVNQVVDRFPGNAKAWLLKGRFHLRVGDVDLADAAMEVTLRLDRSLEDQVKRARETEQRLRRRPFWRGLP